jgi:translation initiation factor 1
MQKDTPLVYSTERGRLCPSCELPVAQCRCLKSKPLPKGDGIVRVARETAGRKGKCVTTITGATLDPEALAKQLKQKCGSGGTVKNGVIEIQGDHRDIVVTELHKLGFTVKRSGG